MDSDKLLQSPSTEKSATATATNGFQSDTRSVSPGDSPPGSNDNTGFSGKDPRPIVPSSGGDQTAAALLKDPAYTSNDTLNLLHEAVQQSENEHARAAGEALSSAATSDKTSGNSVMAQLCAIYPGTNGKGTETDVALEAWYNLRFVRSGLFSAEEALALVDYFYDFLAPFSPVPSSGFERHSQHPKLLEEEPILTVTILILASRYMKLTGPGAMFTLICDTR